MIVRREGPGTSMRATHQRHTAKRAAVLAAAAELIRERGYDGTSLDAIVERAACSKSAVYELFGSKEGLLSALTEDIALELSRALHAFHLAHLDVRETLTRYGELALELILSERHTAIVRATIAAAWKHPAIGVRYFEVGAMAARSALARYFEERTRAGDLVVADAERAAREFQALLFFERIVAQIAGFASAPDRAEITALVAATVSSFLKLYAAPA